MKKFIACIIMMLCFSLATEAQSVVREGNNFTSVSSRKSSENDKQTKFTWTDSKGKIYPIFVAKSGACYVKRISQKTGKEYKYYLGAEISSQVCKELGIKYSPKTK